MQYVIAGYLITFAILGLYSFQLVRRGRSLTRQLPEEDRRFLD